MGHMLLSFLLLFASRKTRLFGPTGAVAPLPSLQPPESSSGQPKRIRRPEKLHHTTANVIAQEGLDMVKDRGTV